MKCFSLIKSKIKNGIPNTYANTIDATTINEASVRFYICEQNGGLLAKAAQSRYTDLFLYGYTELIPDNGPGNLFPENSYLLDIAIADYIPEKSTGCMCIQTFENRVLLGCIEESVIATTEGVITWFKDKPVLNTEVLADQSPDIPPDILVVEL